mmetsp:Transcript_5448/g.10726  ORF Transcript_5448/g.10726 Transcript_5448/m.10726 type:complete len:244 (-) Transcript_5448:91-822(-)
MASSPAHTDPARSSAALSAAARAVRLPVSAIAHCSSCLASASAALCAALSGGGGTCTGAVGGSGFLPGGTPTVNSRRRCSVSTSSSSRCPPGLEKGAGQARRNTVRGTLPAVPERSAEAWSRFATFVSATESSWSPASSPAACATEPACTASTVTTPLACCRRIPSLHGCSGFSRNSLFGAVSSAGVPRILAAGLSTDTASASVRSCKCCAASISQAGSSDKAAPGSSEDSRARTLAVWSRRN